MCWNSVEAQYPTLRWLTLRWFEDAINCATHIQHLTPFSKLQTPPSLSTHMWCPHGQDTDIWDLSHHSPHVITVVIFISSKPTSTTPAISTDMNDDPDNIPGNDWGMAEFVKSWPCECDRCFLPLASCPEFNKSWSYKFSSNPNLAEL